MAETLRSYDGGEGFRLVVELSYPIATTEIGKEMSRDNLKEMLRYEEVMVTPEVISNNPDTGSLKLKLGRFTAGRWESFGYKIVQVFDNGFTSKLGEYFPPEDITELYLKGIEYHNPWI